MGLKEEHLIHNLLNETYGCIPESESAKSSSDLYRYFCKRSHEFVTEKAGTPFENFLKELSLSFSQVHWREQTHCYRFHAFGYWFDLPSNWGPFDDFNIESQGYLHIHPEVDDFLMLKVFSYLAGKDVEAVFLVQENSEMYLSFIELGKEKNLNDILKFAQKSFYRRQNKRSA